MKWDAMFRTAVIEHGLSPQQFWDLSWHEWLWLNPPHLPQCLPRLGLEALIKQYPDHNNANTGF